jgi:heme exporter protein D
MIEFFAMKGYGFYIWMSYGVTAAVLVAEVLALRARRRATLAEAHVTASYENPLDARTAPVAPRSAGGAR